MTGINSKTSQVRPRISARNAKFATVLVGSQHVKFTVHQDLLAFHSPFFRAALIGNFQEAQNKSVTLEEEDPQTFEFFVHWLYYKRLPNEADAPVELLSIWAGEDDRGGLETGNLIRVYIFSEKYDIAALKTCALDDLYNHMTNPCVGLASSSQIGYAIDNLPSNSPMCRYLVDEHCHFATAGVWEDLAALNYPSIFLERVLCRYTEYAHGGLEWDNSMPLCEYHEHKDMAERRSCEAKREG
ncbi:hypothetical protein BU25DRAFT_473880 [Macroventuria anomochaeta]|uniref:Uncharacterized protein n=1 Tax=Macroventuria anomochaeta TaxID=301207 RepID=A0ACB6RU74_9PLEO|nr:uncharacterized protein BU25DRAFT_473880 [Macroventuria anomochaeta]KAF2625324.1 hypothetical protein BU25DRAFT_473880 [Macroventuria anomochaeta]